MNRKNNRKWIAFFAVIWFSGCCCAGSRVAPPNELVAPKPIQGNTGKYMCPYTSDDVLAEWVDMAIKAKLGAAIGKTVGAYAGQKALEQVPIVGGVLGHQVGGAIGRAIAIKAAGGWKRIRETSDLSFNSIDNMAVYLYVKHSNHEHYQEALKATWEIYPKLKSRYYKAIKKAQRKY